MSRKLNIQILGEFEKTASRNHFRETPNVIIEVATRAVAVDAQARLLCYPRGSFYPLSSEHTHCAAEDH